GCVNCSTGSAAASSRVARRAICDTSASDEKEEAATESSNCFARQFGAVLHLCCGMVGKHAPWQQTVVGRRPWGGSALEDSKRRSKEAPPLRIGRRLQNPAGTPERSSQNKRANHQ